MNVTRFFFEEYLSIANEKQKVCFVHMVGEVEPNQNLVERLKNYGCFLNKVQCFNEIILKNEL